ncbi:RDD family protein [Halobacillus aidingensis]|uniref:RDD family protein n=1 Tax=Halobacillus aidingensis TaxID=240303 RepID=A0A1H0LTW4_HALAD|nr:RDD family protein [Halobacillus aidingensis]SDO71632.1 RDD family protein [Halobacillus aidingensis]
MSERNLFLRFIGTGLELIVSGFLAILYTATQNTGRGFDPNPVFWKAFIIIHVSLLILIPLLAKGRTLGMLLTNLTIESNSGKPPNILQIFLRAVLGFVPVILTQGMWYWVSFVTGLMDSKGRGWSELISYTTIKWKEPPLE